ncbi:hypothetical protein CRM22_008328 [Opisthorchis felineus]|uniref:Uncharacterized protein n=1 Tax=Opisthorchis felineus TaxID=147828 RepID=A0A4S2LBN0_OPIFE|nr:hypothetical protein CRM22_008328 [Opisthorchis felineus]
MIRQNCSQPAISEQIKDEMSAHGLPNVTVDPLPQFEFNRPAIFGAFLGDHDDDEENSVVNSTIPPHIAGEIFNTGGDEGYAAVNGSTQTHLP